MHIFNIGFNRCGTTSLSEALGIINYPTLHHNFNARIRGRVENIRLVDFWRRNLKNGRRPFSGLDRKFFSFSDFWGEGCFKQLDTAYPNAKFILTVRNLDDWLDSRERKVMQNLKDPNYRGGFTKVDRNGWRQTYYNHLSSVRSHFADNHDKLLIINISEGQDWEVLCPFLGCEIPTDPFPWKNSLK